MSLRPVVRWTPSNQSERWIPTTLDQLGKYEEFLEELIADSPELLGLESRRTGVRGPFHCIRQVSMQTPSGRSVLPDIVIFAASGHVIVVEVKRYVNPELRDRAVIAQIIDYASSFAVLTEADCVELPLDVVDEHLEDFKSILLWFKAQANARLAEPGAGTQFS